MLLVLPFLLFVGAVIPLLGWLSLRQRNTQTAREDMTGLDTRAVVIQLASLQTIVGGLALLALYGAELDLTWRSTLSTGPLLVSFAVLFVFVAIAVFEARRPLEPADKIRAALRKTSATDPFWVTITLYAGAIEEFAYRGVLTLVLASATGYWPAAVMSALAFGLGHASGGWRSAILAVLFALAMQSIVYISGGLLLAIVVHATYDLLVAWLGHKIHQRNTPP